MEGITPRPAVIPTRNQENGDLGNNHETPPMDPPKAPMPANNVEASEPAAIKNEHDSIEEPKEDISKDPRYAKYFKMLQLVSSQFAFF